jgi:hypothetical protein
LGIPIGFTELAGVATGVLTAEVTGVPAAEVTGVLTTEAMEVGMGAAAAMAAKIVTTRSLKVCISPMVVTVSLHKYVLLNVQENEF